MEALKISQKWGMGTPNDVRHWEQEMREHYIEELNVNDLQERNKQLETQNNNQYDLVKRHAYDAYNNLNKNAKLMSEIKDLKEKIETYKRCFEKFIDREKWDDANLFLMTH